MNRFYPNTMVIPMIFLSTFLIQCSGKNESLQEPLNNSAPKPKEIPVLPPDQCITFTNENVSIPSFIDSEPGKGFFVTRVTKPCLNRDGIQGFAKGSGWMAMGVPCTGGHGRIDIMGKTYRPNMITFELSTDCKMDPHDNQVIEKKAHEILGFRAEMNLLAFNPMSVQFWEIKGQADADVGSNVRMRSQSEESLRNFWGKFKDEGEKFEVKLYGRENAWVQDTHLFLVEATISYQSQMYFNLEVNSARVLSDREIAEVRTKCNELSPKRDCSDL